MTPTTAMPADAAGVGRLHGLLALGLALVWALVLPQLRPLLPVDETRYLTVAWEMHGAGSAIVPHLNGEIYAHKPPLLFWLINLVWSLTGVSEVAARLVAPAFGVLAVALTWRLGDRLFPERPGLGGRAALILASTGIFVLYGSLTMFDTMLCVAVLVGVLALWQIDRGKGWPAIALLGAALAFGVLAKGPVVLVHLVPLALTRPLWSMAPPDGRPVAWFASLLGALAVALAIIGLWLGPALWLGGPEYRAEVLWRQSAGRMVNAFDHARPFWFFLAALPVLLWPWAWRGPVLRGLASRGLFRDRRARALAIWGGATLVLFSLISGKQVHYLLPALPAAALALAAVPPPRPGLGPAALSLLVTAPVLVWAWLLSTGAAQIDGAPVTSLGPLDLALPGGLAIGLLLALAFAGRRAPTVAWALVAPASLVVVHLALRAPLQEHFDTARFAAELARAPQAGIGIVGRRYQGEFGFTARLAAPIQPLDTEALASWIAAHPGGLLIAGGPQSLPLSPVGDGWLAGTHLYLYRLP
ncbi:glycosyltransferase family 39 protein [Rhodobacter sp. Har01]|uniref:ArnT family glycosyltransferase n=1 Tax=Rhodobacter sp. Har01 TaxID=2883999 RepID=UPI001D08496A|nr:glycosyltransferase family 39 protein [Rhodobacter sp. Har01]MCB6179607.1 glycosyltransferase family 39 protein [Rhodobacter sp. Har01]